MTEETNPWKNLNFEQRVELVQERLGHPTDMITDPRQLIDHAGEKLYLVISPFGQDEQDIANIIVFEWVIGEIKDHFDNLITHDTEIDPEITTRYILYHHKNRENGISCRDFNIIPNGYNNHASFLSKDSAQAYALYRKMSFDQNDALKQVDDNFIFFVNEEDVARLRESDQEQRRLTEE